MKPTKMLALLLALLTSALLAGCGAEAQGPAADAPAKIAIVDMMGREVTLDAPAEKVVALTAADCEILYALGAGDCIVGRGEYCNYPEEALSLPAVQSGAVTNVEEIIALAPQVVFMSKMDQSKEQVEALEAAGIKVVESYERDIAGVYESIANIGAVMGRDAEAKALIESMKAGFAEIEAASAVSDKTVYFEVSPLEWGLWTAGTGTFMDELATMLGVTNVFSDVEGWKEVSEEQVIERDPDYIVTITMYYGEGPTPEEEIASRAGWANIEAVKNGAILGVDSDAICRPGPRLVDAAKALGEFFAG